MGPSSKDFLTKITLKMGHTCRRIFGEIYLILGCTSTYALICELPPPPGGGDSVSNYEDVFYTVVRFFEKVRKHVLLAVQSLTLIFSLPYI